METIEVKKLEAETRKEYLVRVAIAMLNENACCIEPIIYDEVECDAFCLAEDLAIEFGIDIDTENN